MILPSPPWSTAAGSVSLCHSIASPPPTACELTRYHHPATEPALATTSTEMHRGCHAAKPGWQTRCCSALLKATTSHTRRCSLAGVPPCIAALAQLHRLTGCTNGGFRFVSPSCDGSHKELVLCQLPLRLYCRPCVQIVGACAFHFHFLRGEEHRVCSLERGDLILDGIFST